MNLVFLVSCLFCIDHNSVEVSEPKIFQLHQSHSSLYAFVFSMPDRDVIVIGAWIGILQLAMVTHIPNFPTLLGHFCKYDVSLKG